MGPVMTIIMARATTEVFGGLMFSYSGITITAISTTILDSEGLRAEMPGVGFMEDFTEAVVVTEEAAFTEEAVVVAMEGAAVMGDDGQAAEIL